MKYYIDAKDGVLARSSASTSSEIVGVGIPWGYVVAGASVSAPSGWYAVQWAGRNAFIPATYAHAVDDSTPLTDNKYNYGPSSSSSSASGGIFLRPKEWLQKLINGGSSSGSSGRLNNVGLWHISSITATQRTSARPDTRSLQKNCTQTSVATQMSSNVCKRSMSNALTSC